MSGKVNFSYSQETDCSQLLPWQPCYKLIISNKITLLLFITEPRSLENPSKCLPWNALFGRDLCCDTFFSNNENLDEFQSHSIQSILIVFVFRRATRADIFHFCSCHTNFHRQRRTEFKRYWHGNWSNYFSKRVEHHPSIAELICETLAALEGSGTCTITGQADVRAQWQNCHQSCYWVDQYKWCNNFRLHTPHRRLSSMLLRCG